MKILAVILALMLASSWSAFGKAYFFTQSELIEKAAVIAIISLGEPEVAQPTGNDLDPFATEGARGKNWVYSQQAKVRVEKVLKGKIPNDFILYGKESFICAQCALSKGRFLAFLSKDGEFWVGTNWHLSLRPIREGEVEWYISDEQRYPMKFQKLKGIVAQIQTALEKQQSESSCEVIISFSKKLC